jgi:hypothetical protein
MTGDFENAILRAVFFAAAALIGMCLGILLILLAVVVRRAKTKRELAAEAAALRPRLLDALAKFVAGGSDKTLLASAMATQGEEVAECVMLFLRTVSGSTRERLCQLTLDLGLVQRWCEDLNSGGVPKRRAAVERLAMACVSESCRNVLGDLLPLALRDEDSGVRLCACRGLALSGSASEVGQLFALALGPDLLMRAVLTEDLRRHSMTLAAGPVREALHSGSDVRTAAALEMLAAWERAIPIESLAEFLEHRARQVQVLAFRLAAYLPVDYESRLALVRALQNPDEEIRALATIAIGHQKMTEALPELAQCLRRSGADLARHAAEALAAMPPVGWETLEELSSNRNAATAKAAREALAHARGNDVK